MKDQTKNKFAGIVFLFICISQVVLSPCSFAEPESSLVREFESVYTKYTTESERPSKLKKTTSEYREQAVIVFGLAENVYSIGKKYTNQEAKITKISLKIMQMPHTMRANQKRR